MYIIDKILFSVAPLSIIMILEGERARTQGGGLETLDSTKPCISANISAYLQIYLIIYMVHILPQLIQCPNYLSSTYKRGQQTSDALGYIDILSRATKAIYPILTNWPPKQCNWQQALRQLVLLLCYYSKWVQNHCKHETLIKYYLPFYLCFELELNVIII